MDMPAISKDITLTFGTIVSFVVICSAGEELQGQFKDLNIYVRNKWYQYPAKIQRVLTIIILDSQNSDLFKVGNITASRETFKKVCTI